eukprot:scaffold105987_cov53-Phaeocystis_antarctica.AAC.2
MQLCNAAGYMGPHQNKCHKKNKPPRVFNRSARAQWGRHRGQAVIEAKKGKRQTAALLLTKVRASRVTSRGPGRGVHRASR